MLLLAALSCAVKPCLLGALVTGLASGLASWLVVADGVVGNDGMVLVGATPGWTPGELGKEGSPVDAAGAVGPGVPGTPSTPSTPRGVEYAGMAPLLGDCSIANVSSGVRLFPTHAGKLGFGGVRPRGATGALLGADVAALLDVPRCGGAAGAGGVGGATWLKDLAGAIGAGGAAGVDTAERGGRGGGVGMSSGAGLLKPCRTDGVADSSSATEDWDCPPPKEGSGGGAGVEVAAAAELIPKRAPNTSPIEMPPVDGALAAATLLKPGDAAGVPLPCFSAGGATDGAGVEVGVLAGAVVPSLVIVSTAFGLLAGAGVVWALSTAAGVPVPGVFGAVASTPPKYPSLDGATDVPGSTLTPVVAYPPIVICPATVSTVTVPSAGSPIGAGAACAVWTPGTPMAWVATVSEICCVIASSSVRASVKLCGVTPATVAKPCGATLGAEDDAGALVVALDVGAAAGAALSTEPTSASAGDVLASTPTPAPVPGSEPAPSELDADPVASALPAPMPPVVSCPGFEAPSTPLSADPPPESPS